LRHRASTTYFFLVRDGGSSGGGGVCATGIGEFVSSFGFKLPKQIKRPVALSREMYRPVVLCHLTDGRFFAIFILTPSIGTSAVVLVASVATSVAKAFVRPEPGMLFSSCHTES
jgi:hypothetical protein